MDWDFSRATFYRRLDRLKKQGLIEWRQGRAKITERGEQVIRLFDPFPSSSSSFPGLKTHTPVNSA